MFHVPTGPTGEGAKLPTILADAHLLAPNLQNGVAAQCRGYRMERAGARPVGGFGNVRLNRRVLGHEIPIPNAVA